MWDISIKLYGPKGSVTTKKKNPEKKTRLDKPSFARLPSIAQRLSCKYQRCRNYGWMLKLDWSAFTLLRKYLHATRPGSLRGLLLKYESHLVLCEVPCVCKVQQATLRQTVMYIPADTPSVFSVLQTNNAIFKPMYCSIKCDIHYVFHIYNFTI